MPKEKKSLQAVIAALPPHLLRQNIELGLVELEAVDHEGKTILHHVAELRENGALVLAEILASIKAKPETLTEQVLSKISALLTTPDNHNKTAFQYAAHSPELLTVMLPYILFNQQLDFIIQEDGNGSNMLHTACCDSPESLKLLLALLPSDRCLDELAIKKNKQGQSVLQDSIRYDQVSTVLSYIPSEHKTKCIQDVFLEAVWHDHKVSDGYASYKSALDVFLAELTPAERAQVILTSENDAHSVFRRAQNISYPTTVKLLNALSFYERMVILLSDIFLAWMHQRSMVEWRKIIQISSPDEKLKTFQQAVDVIKQLPSEKRRNLRVNSFIVSREFLKCLLHDMNAEQLFELLQTEYANDRSYQETFLHYLVYTHSTSACALAVDHILEKCTPEQIITLLQPILPSLFVVSGSGDFIEAKQVFCAKIKTKLSEQQRLHLLMQIRYKREDNPYHGPVSVYGASLVGELIVETDKSRCLLSYCSKKEDFLSLVRTLPSYCMSAISGDPFTRLRVNYTVNEIRDYLIKILKKKIDISRSISKDDLSAIGALVKRYPKDKDVQQAIQATYSYGEKLTNRWYHARPLGEARIAKLIHSHQSPSFDFSFLQRQQYKDTEGKPLSSDSLKRKIFDELKKQILETPDQTQLDNLLKTPTTKAKMVLLECRQGMASSLFNLETSSSKALATLVSLHKKSWQQQAALVPFVNFL